MLYFKNPASISFDFLANSFNSLAISFTLFKLTCNCCSSGIVSLLNTLRNNPNRRDTKINIKNIINPMGNIEVVGDCLLQRKEREKKIKAKQKEKKDTTALIFKGAYCLSFFFCGFLSILFASNVNAFILSLIFFSFISSAIIFECSAVSFVCSAVSFVCS